MELIDEMGRFFVSSLISDFRTSNRVGDDNDFDYRTTIYIDLIHYLGGCTVGFLSDLMGLDKSTVSKKVDGMVSKGILSKERDPEDGRVQRITINPDWETMLDAYDEPYIRAAERLVEELSEEERATVCRALRIMSETIWDGVR